MKIAACQFAVSGNVDHNLAIITKYTSKAAQQGAALIIFPECALSGYPPLDIPFAADADFAALKSAYSTLYSLSAERNIHILIGSITRSAEGFLNSAVLFAPDKEPVFYHKRALWGWDSENFVPGSTEGIFDINDVKIGVRICYEVRFPEYFRELFRHKTDLNIVLFHDTCPSENQERFELIRAHLRTRAAENVTPLFSVNTSAAFQTAPTALFNGSGKVLCELPCQTEALLVCDCQSEQPDFSQTGRNTIAGRLLGL